jgi:hypothetical protein
MVLTASDRRGRRFDQAPALAGRSGGVVRILMQFQSKDLEHFQSLCYTDRAAKESQSQRRSHARKNRNPKRTAVNKVASPPARAVEMICGGSLLGGGNGASCGRLVSTWFCI